MNAWGFVGFGDEGLYSGAELVFAREVGATQGFSREDAKPHLDLVEPTGRGRREMKLHTALVLGQPVVVLLMRAIVVQDGMDLFVVRHPGADTILESPEVLAFLLAGRLRMNRSAWDLQWGEQV